MHVNSGAETQEGDAPGLGQQREDMVRVLAELVATQRAAVAPGVLRSLSNQRRT